MRNIKGRIRKTTRSLGARAFLFTGRSDIYYLTGLELEGFWLLVKRGGAAVFAPKMLSGQLKALMPAVEIVSGDDMIGLLAGYLKRRKLRRVSVNGSAVSYRLFNKLSGKINVKDEGDILARQRIIKDDGELKAIKNSCRITLAAMKYARKLIKPGMTEEEIAFKIESFFLNYGARPAFPLIVAAGANSANPHHVSSSTKIKRNDVILIDIGCAHKGYCSDLTRTFFLGKTNNLRKKVYSAVELAHKKALSSVKAGVKTAAIDMAARETIEKAGYGENFIHTTGHGVGIDIHEAPRLSAKDNTVLKPGMVVTVEPGIYLQGMFGVRIEDTVAVTKKGREVLTK